ncbi:rap guanine nucleotide exchange factor 3 [Egretta garzetta]|uniref:rap guanine nucleotide exchange factor 3 n=1 Tax=Egretta garzetta TaxID=188379 RepID=UPI00163C4049|nr:rap guanine nucleotide exchange factor 3 [Egretta garzetta]
MALIPTPLLDTESTLDYGHSLTQAPSDKIWRAGKLLFMKQEWHFQDKETQFYRFAELELSPEPGAGLRDAEELLEALAFLAQLGPDALLTMALRKPPAQRTEDELELIFEELLHIYAVAHLSNSVKRELASVLMFESHQRAGTVLFSQGDKGTSWYIIWKGSVNVVTHGKGLVATLHEGYLVMAGTPEKILEHLLEFMRLDATLYDPVGRWAAPFALTYTVFMPTSQLCRALLHHFRAEPLEGSEQEKATYSLHKRRKILRLVSQWVLLYGRLLQGDRSTTALLQTPHPEQLGPHVGSSETLDLISSKDLASHLTDYDWNLFKSIHQVEMIHYIVGPQKFHDVTTANLERVMRRFNELQYWVATELCLCPEVGRRAQLLRKFIKLAAHLKEQKNLNSFFAVMFGVSNTAVSRLAKTWEEVPGKLEGGVSLGGFVSPSPKGGRSQGCRGGAAPVSPACPEVPLHPQDPSWNHRVYRLAVAKLSPPIIPFVPLLLKDMTFIHEGNRTLAENLINFEKMVSGAGRLPVDTSPSFWGTCCPHVPWDADPWH